MSGWGCPHYINERCRLMQTECEPGKKGCVLYGAFTFAPPPPPLEDDSEEGREDNETKQPSKEKEPPSGKSS